MIELKIEVKYMRANIVCQEASVENNQYHVVVMGKYTLL